MGAETRASPAAEVVDAGTDAFFDRLRPVLASRPAEALRIARDELARAEALGDRLAVVRALLVCGMAHSALGDPERDATLARALALAQAEAEPLTLVRAVNAQIVVDIFNGRYADALWRGQEVLGMAHALRRRDLLWRLTINLGSALSLIGEYQMAIAMYRECLELLQGESDEVRQQRHQTINNMAWSWMGVARLAMLEDDTTAAREALGVARRFAEGACEGALRERNPWLRASALDTLVGVLLELGEARQAEGWVERVTQESAGLLAPGTPAWGIHTLARCRVELAQPEADGAAVLAALREVEALPGPIFRSGDLHAALHRCLSDALARVGQHQAALEHHGRWLQFEARTQSLLAREHAMSVQRTLETLRGETEEFITHDLRNPLGAARVQLGALRAARGQAPALAGRADAIEALLGEATRAADHYLVVLRTRHVRRAMLQPLDLAELVDDVGEQLAPPAGTGVRLERELDWGVLVRGDRIALLQALQELVRLALASAGPGDAVRITLAGDAGGPLLRIEAPGEGWMLRLSQAMREGGAGGAPTSAALGGWMVARVAQLHDARLEVRPAAGQAHAAVEWRFRVAE